jgi:hypothetical protein
MEVNYCCLLSSEIYIPFVRVWWWFVRMIIDSVAARRTNISSDCVRLPGFGSKGRVVAAAGHPAQVALWLWPHRSHVVFAVKSGAPSSCSWAVGPDGARGNRGAMHLAGVTCCWPERRQGQRCHAESLHTTASTTCIVLSGLSESELCELWYEHGRFRVTRH